MSDKSHILIVDDERSMQEFLEIFFRRDGHVVSVASGTSDARERLLADQVDLVISDMQMPDGSGLEVLQAVQQHCPEVPVIMITAYATTDSAIAAMKDGAYDYVTKPFKVDELGVVVDKALEKKKLTTENRRLRSELRTQAKARSMIGNSGVMQRVFEMVGRVAETKTNVLVSGDSGTGKELVARAIHDESERCAAPFVAVNCGAIPANLLESELFGHVRGAFTGAVGNKEGLFEIAEGGTLFLDEIGELPPPLQVKLLRAIQEKTIRRVGDTGDRVIDARIISATNRDLEAEVAAGRFREDLYYRLNVINVHLPPLRDRGDDIELLAHHFLGQINEETGTTLSLNPELLQALRSHPWPGNIRELQNEIRRVHTLADGELDPAHLSSRVTKEKATDCVQTGLDQVREAGSLKDAIEQLEAQWIAQALQRCDGHRGQVCDWLGIPKTTLYAKMRRYGLSND